MNIIDYIYFGMLFGTILIFIIRHNQLDMIVRPLIYYLLIIAIASSLKIYIGLILHRSNLFVDHFSTPLEYAALSVLFYHSLERRFVKRVIIISIPGFIALSICLSMFVDRLPNDNNSIAKVVRALLSTTWILLFFRQLLISDKVLNVTGEPLFWIYTSFLFYFLGTMVLQGFFMDLIKLERELAYQLYTFIEYSCDYVLFIGINIGLLCRKQFTWQGEK